MSLSELGKETNEINRANGWDIATPEDFDNVDKMLRLLMLIVTEVAEAAEAVRLADFENFKEEMADILIRVLDTTEGMGIDIDFEVRTKLGKNRARGYRHGGKRA